MVTTKSVTKLKQLWRICNGWYLCRKRKTHSEVTSTCIDRQTQYIAEIEGKLKNSQDLYLFQAMLLNQKLKTIEQYVA